MKGLKKYKVNDEAMYTALAERKTSLAGVARNLGISRQALYHQLQGENLSFNLVMAMSSELGMTPNEFIEEA